MPKPCGTKSGIQYQTDLLFNTLKATALLNEYLKSFILSSGRSFTGV
jgi:hypothetical protein